LPIKSPSSSELSNDFEAVRAWVASLQSLSALRIEWRSLQHRVLGSQQLPATIWVDQLEPAVRWLKQTEATEQLRTLLAHTEASLPALRDWVLQHPLQAISFAAVWPQLLAVVAWRQAHASPGIYLRQVDIPGVHSKFIERHQAVLTQLFTQVGIVPLPNTTQFAARFGFLERPTRIRLRALDPEIQIIANTTFVDLKLDQASFARLDFRQFGAPLRRVFITENEINYLSFPPLANAIVIFGAGYGWEALASAVWLHQCEIYYWGDIDTHGFAILAQLRQYFPQVHSILMDQATLLQHQSLWGVEAQQQRADLPTLNAAEAAVYDLLRDNRLRQGLRLEQEHIGFGWLQQALTQLNLPASDNLRPP
jgi:hypothetical protein